MILIVNKNLKKMKKFCITGDPTTELMNIINLIIIN